MITHCAGFDSRRIRPVVSPGGIEAWLLQDATLPIVSMAFSFNGGTTQDGADKGGTARMLAALLNEGAGSLDGEAFRIALSERAVQLDFSVQNDALIGRLRSLAGHAEAAFDLLALALREPRFDGSSVDRVRERISGALLADRSRADVAARRLFLGAGYGRHPYARAIEGDVGALDAITREDLSATHRTTMARGNLKVTVVGDIGEAALVKALDRVFGGLPASPALKPVATTRLGGLGTCRFGEIDVPQSAIEFGRPAIGRHDPDLMVAVLIGYCFGGGCSSRLFREAREKRGLCYAITSYLDLLDHAATLRGMTATRTERAEEMIDLIQAEVRKLLRDGLATDEIEKAKRYLIGAYALLFDSSRSIADLLLRIRCDGREPGWFAERARRIAAIDGADVARVLPVLFGDGELLFAVAGRTMPW